MQTIDNAVTKILKEREPDIDSPEFAKYVIKNAPNTVSKYHECTSDSLIREYLFEHSELGKQLQKILDILEEREKNERNGN